MIPWRDLPAALTGAAADLLAPDACHLCGCHYDPGLARRFPVSPRAGALTAPLEFRVGAMVLNTHPLCHCCAGELRETTGEEKHDVGVPVHSAFLTNETLLRVVHVMKFSRVAALASGVAAAIACALQERGVLLGERTLLVPVPMDRRSLRRRGFNQSAEIAAALGRKLGIEVSYDVVRKVRKTHPQSLTAVEKRGENVRDAFAPGRGSVRGRDTVIVDDIVTTGATIGACATALGRAHSLTAVCLGCAREPAASRRRPFLQS